MHVVTFLHITRSLLVCACCLPPVSAHFHSVIRLSMAEETIALTPVEDERTASGTSSATGRTASADTTTSESSVEVSGVVVSPVEGSSVDMYAQVQLGWTRLSKENGRHLRILRWCLVLCWNLALILTFTTQLMTCYTRDRFNPGKLVNTTHGTERDISCNFNVVTALIAQDIVILITYWFGLHLFSCPEREYTLNLAEKMFIKLSTSQDVNTKLVVKTIWAFIVGGLTWIVFSIIVRVMSIITIQTYESQTIIHLFTVLRDEVKIVLVSITFVGFIVYDLVYFMAITNYVVQSEMVFYLIHSVKKLVKRRQYPSMDATIKDICDIREKLHRLNGKTSAVAAMALIIVASNVISVLVTLDDLRRTDHPYKNGYLTIIASFLNTILWIVPLLLPYIQAARISHQCDHLKQTGFYLRTRPFQYSRTPMSELDSYIIFIQAAKLRATMCGIPIYPCLLYALLVLVSLFFVSIFQLKDFELSRYLNG